MAHDAPFTIKHILSNGGVCYWPATAIITIPHDLPKPPDSNDTPVSQGYAAPTKRVEFEKGDGTDIRGMIDTGVVFIMNASGKTIDRIFLH